MMLALYDDERADGAERAAIFRGLELARSEYPEGSPAYVAYTQLMQKVKTLTIVFRSYRS